MALRRKRGRLCQSSQRGQCEPMKRRSLTLDLTADLYRYIDDQVRAGRYEDENEVVREALRQMQQRELQEFERLFGDYSGAPKGEPTTEDEAAIRSAIQRHRE